MATVSAVNDAAHSAEGTISLLLGALDDARVKTHGIRDPSSGEFTCVCLTMGLGDDVSIQFVATKVQQLCSGHLCCAEQVSWEEMQYVGPIPAICTECLHVCLALEDLEHTHLSHGGLAQPDLHVAVRRVQSVMQALPARLECSRVLHSNCARSLLRLAEAAWQGYCHAAHSAAMARMEMELPSCRPLPRRWQPPFGVRQGPAQAASVNLSGVVGCRRSTAGGGWQARCCAAYWRLPRARARKRRRCRPRRRGWACTLAWASGRSRCCAHSCAPATHPAAMRRAVGSGWRARSECCAAAPAVCALCAGDVI